MLQYITPHWKFIISIIFAFIIGYFFHLLSISEREPVHRHENNSPIFSSPQGVSTNYFKVVSRSSGEELLGTIFKSDHVFWNNGRKVIKANHILKPLKIIFDSNVKIIDTFISESSKPDLVNPRVSHKPEGNVVEIGFDILEQHHGFRFHVIYLASEPSELIMQGHVEEASIQGLEDVARKYLPYGIGKTALYIIIFVLLIWSLDRYSKRAAAKETENDDSDEAAMSPSRTKVFLSNIVFAFWLLAAVLSGGSLLVGNILDNSETAAMQVLDNMELIKK